VVLFSKGCYKVPIFGFYRERAMEMCLSHIAQRETIQKTEGVLFSEGCYKVPIFGFYRERAAEMCLSHIAQRETIRKNQRAVL